MPSGGGVGSAAGGRSGTPRSHESELASGGVGSAAGRQSRKPARGWCRSPGEHPRQRVILRRRGRFRFGTALGREGCLASPRAGTRRTAGRRSSGARRVRSHGTAGRSPDSFPARKGEATPLRPSFPASTGSSSWCGEGAGSRGAAGRRRSPARRRNGPRARSGVPVRRASVGVRPPRGGGLHSGSKGRFRFATAFGREGCLASPTRGTRLAAEWRNSGDPSRATPRDYQAQSRLPSRYGGRHARRANSESGWGRSPAAARDSVLSCSARAASHFRPAPPAMRDCLETRHQGLGFVERRFRGSPSGGPTGLPGAVPTHLPRQGRSAIPRRARSRGPQVVRRRGHRTESKCGGAVRRAGGVGVGTRGGALSFGSRVASNSSPPSGVRDAWPAQK